MDRKFRRLGIPTCIYEYSSVSKEEELLAATASAGVVTRNSIYFKEIENKETRSV